MLASLLEQITGDTQAEKIKNMSEVSLLLPDGQRYAVTGGLSKGDRIVTNGIATLRNEMIIKIEE